MDNKLFSDHSTFAARPLRIDFDLYTESDEAYKHELVGLIIENLREFQSALRASIQSRDSELFHKACHKSKVTLSMLDDIELDRIVEDLQQKIGNAEKNASLISKAKIFHELTDSIINSLKTEIGKFG